MEIQCFTASGEPSPSIMSSNRNNLCSDSGYDFTPLSVDEERMGKLEVQENSGVSVSLPHNDGVNATNYKGQAKPASTKDCILIIDHETGELTLERLSNQVENSIHMNWLVIYYFFISF